MATGGLLGARHVQFDDWLEVRKRSEGPALASASGGSPGSL